MLDNNLSLQKKTGFRPTKYHNFAIIDTPFIDLAIYILVFVQFGLICALILFASVVDPILVPRYQSVGIVLVLMFLSIGANTKLNNKKNKIKNHFRSTIRNKLAPVMDKNPKNVESKKIPSLREFINPSVNSMKRVTKGSKYQTQVKYKILSRKSYKPKFM